METDKEQLNTNERSMALATIMVHVLAIRYELSDAEMHEVCGIALHTQFAAEQGQEEAVRICEDAVGRLRDVWRTVQAKRDDKTVN